MAVFSIIHRKSLTEEMRLDAEYYHPAYLAAEKALSHCKTIPLGKLAYLTTSAFYPAAADLYSIGDIPFARCVDVIDFPVIQSDQDFRKIPASFVQENSTIKTAYPRDVIITKVGTPCYSSFIDSSIPRIALSRTVLGVLNVKEDVVLVEYLVSFLRSRFGFQQLMRERELTIQLQLTLRRVKSVRIYIPSREFQKTVASVITRYSSERKKSLELYYQAEQLLLSELGLQDWKPARALTFVRSYSQAAKAGRMDAEYFHSKYQEMLSRISSQIRFDRLGRLITYTKGVEVGSEAYTDTGIPFWRVSNLSKQGLDDSNANFISQSLYESLRQNYEPQQGEILLSKDATPGLAYYLEHPIQGIVSSGILRLAIIDNIPPHYLELVLNSLFVQMQIEQDAGSSIIKHWKPSEVRKTLIPRLSDDKEKKIAQLVEKSHAARREAKALLEKAKRAVEIAIEENEERAMEFIG